MPLIGVFTPLIGVLIKIMWSETRYACAFILKVPATLKKSLYVLSYEFKLVRAIIPTLCKAVPPWWWGRGMGCNHLFVI